MLLWNELRFGACICDYLIWQEAGNVAFKTHQLVFYMRDLANALYNEPTVQLALNFLDNTEAS